MAGAAAAMDEGGELLAGNGRRQRPGEEGGEAGVVLVELSGGVAGRHGSAKRDDDPRFCFLPFAAPIAFFACSSATVLSCTMVVEQRCRERRN